MTCTASRSTELLSRAGRPLVIGHRGAPAHAPENTLASFLSAIKAGADVLETDLWVTRDGVIVCHHDRSLGRVTDGRGSIPRLDCAGVKAARVTRSEHGDFADRYQDERVPTLDELLAFVPETTGLALELKDPSFARPGRMRHLLDTIAARVWRGTVMLLSFQVELLRAARRQQAAVWVGLICEVEPHPRFEGNGVGTSWQAMQANPGYMDEARGQGLFVCPLDTAPEPRLPWYLELGVDAVLSEDPARTLAALRALGAG